MLIFCKGLHRRVRRDMIPFERQEFMLKEMKKGTVYIQELAKILSVSEITVRRDLKELEERNLITILRGGAAKLIDTTRETSMDQREGLYAKEKEQIGEYAASLVKNGDVIFIDSGTTTKKMMKYLTRHKDIQIITNGYKNVEEGILYDLPVTLIGGELKRETYAFIGPITRKVIDMYYFDKCFLGANGIEKEFGLSNADPNESLIKEQVIHRSRKSYVVSDHTKFDSNSVFTFARLSEVEIITDLIPVGYSNDENIIVAHKE